MELTIKINEFLAAVKTVENSWKQFDVDTGDLIVTIAVKPKVFKKLEQAQETYPQWMAAIAGQMGEMTDRGFVLKKPNIQVFEKKPKESKEAAPPNCQRIGLILLNWGKTSEAAIRGKLARNFYCASILTSKN